jgi:hypothetical protein
MDVYRNPQTVVSPSGKTLHSTYSVFQFAFWSMPLCHDILAELGPPDASGEGLAPSSSAPISLGLQIVQGIGAEFKVAKSAVGLNIQAGTASVDSMGQNDFMVAQDPTTAADTVAVYQGNVSVQPSNSGLQPVTLSTGQYVVVTKDSISSVTPIGAPAPSGGGSPPPPPPPSGGPSVSGSLLQIAQALDTDHNNKIDDDEVKTADVDWTTGQDIAGTNFTISDDDMKQLFQMWVTSEAITAAGTSAASANLSSLQVRSIEARTLDTHSVRFVAEGQGIVGMEAQVFDLSGKLVFDQETIGTTLTFSGLGTDGRPLANGVYLYLVNVRGADGETITSEVRKLIILH